MNSTQHSDRERDHRTGGLAAALRALPDRLPHERTTLGDILKALGERATAFILLFFSIPAIVPTPGIPAGMIFGTALALLAAVVADMRMAMCPQLGASGLVLLST
jgi:hypothetical protein